MSDPKGEPTHAAQEPLQNSALAARLLARGTQSLGCIDVRGAEAHYARIMDWLAARTPLLEHLRTRYGLAEDEKARGLNLAFAEAPAQAGAEGAAEGFSLSASPESFTPPAAAQTFTYVAHVPDEPTSEPAAARRIGRRGVPTFSRAGSETVPTADTQHGRGEGAEPASAQASPTGAQGSSTGARESTRDVQAHVPRSSFNVRESPASPELHAMQAQDAQTREPLPLAAPAAAPDESPAHARSNAAQGEGDSPAAGSADAAGRTGKPLAHAEELQAGTRTPATPLAFAPQDAREPAKRDAPSASRSTSDNVAARGEPTAAGPSGVKTPSAESSAGRMRVVREQVGVPRAPGASQVLAPNRADGEKAVRAFVVGRSEAAHLSVGAPSASAEAALASTEAAFASAGAPLAYARAREIQAGTQAGAVATAGTLPPLPLAVVPAEAARAQQPHAQQTQTQTQQRTAAQSAPGAVQASAGGADGQALGQSRPGARAGEVNVERLTEQVSRQLARRLLVERERRGLGRK